MSTARHLRRCGSLYIGGKIRCRANTIRFLNSSFSFLFSLARSSLLGLCYHFKWSFTGLVILHSKKRYHCSRIMRSMFKSMKFAHLDMGCSISLTVHESYRDCSGGNLHSIFSIHQWGHLFASHWFRHGHGQYIWSVAVDPVDGERTCRTSDAFVEVGRHRSRFEGALSVGECQCLRPSLGWC